MRITLSILFIPFLVSGPLPAQIADSMQLDSIEVVSSYLRSAAIGDVTVHWDKKRLELLNPIDLSDVLRQTGTAFIKSYGLGSIATSSIRGGSAEHTAVLWNGVPIQNRMLGQSDFSLINPLLMDQVDMQLGGGSTLWGSGAVVASINLQNIAKPSRHLEVTSISTAASFKGLGQYLRFSLGRKKWSSNSSFFHSRARNAFPYRLSNRTEQIIQSNNQFRSTGGMQSFFYRPHPQGILSVHVWLQDTERQIPPRTTQRISDAHQRDHFVRTLLTYRSTTPRTILEAKASFFSEFQSFTDPTILLHAEHLIQTSTAELNYQRKWKKAVASLGTTHVYAKASSENYGKGTDEIRNAIILSGRFTWYNWHLQTSLRTEMIDGNLAPTLPSVGIQWKMSEHIQIRSKISRNYRLPTLNDRFWHPGGNVDLRPEHGWSQSLSLILSHKIRSHQFQYRITGFNRLIKDWILWTPIENNAFWQSTNLARVWSRGLEQRVDFSPMHPTMHKIFISHQFVRSTNQRSLNVPRIDQGDQLLYTPVHQGLVGFVFRYKKIWAEYHHSFIGAYKGINRQLSEYNLGDIIARYNADVGKVPMRLSLELKNVFNANYQTIEDRAMPGRHYRITCQLKFEKTEKS